MTPNELSPSTEGLPPPADERIPGRLNLVIATAQIGGLLVLLAMAGTARSGWIAAACCAAGAGAGAGGVEGRQHV